MMNQKKIILNQYIPHQFSGEYRQQYKALVTNNTKENLKLVCLKFYSNFKLECKCCKEKNLAFLTLEHPKQDGAKRRKNNHPKGGVALYTWLILHNFYEELEVLCHNCNWGRFRNKGICPHMNESEIGRKIDAKNT